MSKEKLRVLCLDIEGGYGGSSRSLFESIAHLDSVDIDAEIWCKRPGPIQGRYNSIGVPVHVTPSMPKVSSLSRLSRNLYIYGSFIIDWLRSHSFRKRLVKAADNFDVVHFNHESLFLLARWLKPRTEAALSMHVRTNLNGTTFCKWQTRSIVNTLDHLIFITENEHRSTSAHSRQNAHGTVIYNIVQPNKARPIKTVPSDGRFKIACLSNYAWVRGLDRTIDIAKVLRANDRSDIVFVMAGDMSLTRSLPGELGKIGAAGGTLEDYVKINDLADWFLFLGHVPDPERVLAASDALIKPTREANPWGRDIQEGLAAGKPVISVGNYDKFVEDRVTGVIQKLFDADNMAERICELADDRGLAKRIGETGRNRILKLCDGPSRASDLLEVWRKMAIK